MLQAPNLQLLVLAKTDFSTDLSTGSVEISFYCLIALSSRKLPATKFG
jgi:hypothetical protein